MMLALLCVWTGAIATCVGLGRLADGRRPLVAADSFLNAFWTGLVLVSGALQIIHLFVPVRWPIGVLFVTVAAAPFMLAVSDLGARFRRHPRAVAFWIGLSIWMANRSIDHGRPWDFGLYHAPTVQLFTSLPLVRGIANLHWRLAANSSFLLTSALFDLPGLGIHAYQVAGGLLVAMLAAEGVCGLSRVLAGSAAVRVSDLVRSAGLPIALFESQTSLPTLSPDAAFLVVGFASAVRLAVLLFDDVEARYLVESYRLVVLLSLLAVTVKLTAVPYATASIAVAFLAVRRRVPAQSLWKAVGFPAACAVALVGVWAYRGVLLSGYPAFPWYAISVNVDWRVPYSSAYTYTEEVRWYTRGVTGGAVADGWLRRWLIGMLWLEGKFSVIVPLAFGVIVVTAARLRRISCWSRDGFLFLVPAVTGGVAWFVVAPAPRLAGVTFWHLGVGLALLPLAESEAGRPVGDGSGRTVRRRAAWRDVHGLQRQNRAARDQATGGHDPAASAELRHSVRTAALHAGYGRSLLRSTVSVHAISRLAAEAPRRQEDGRGLSIARLGIAPNQITDFPERAAEVTLHFFPVALARGQDAIGQSRERQRLEPDPAWPGHRREEQSFAAEQRRLDAADELDVVVDGRIEGDQTAGIDADDLALLSIPSARSSRRCE